MQKLQRTIQNHGICQCIARRDVHILVVVDEQDPPAPLNWRGLLTAIIVFADELQFFVAHVRILDFELLIFSSIMIRHLVQKTAFSISDNQRASISIKTTLTTLAGPYNRSMRQHTGKHET
jgi:hypothetical protein